MGQVCSCAGFDDPPQNQLAPNGHELNGFDPRQSNLTTYSSHPSTYSNSPGSTSVSPCIARGTWASTRRWNSFRREFLAQKRPIFLQPDEDVCPVCLKLFFEDRGAKPIRLPCDRQHVVCRKCARGWFRRGKREPEVPREAKNTCPTCRQVLFWNDGPSNYEEHQAQQEQIF